MSDDQPTTDSGTNDPAPRSPEVAAIEADLEATRERLAGTIDALGAKLDVKTRTQDKVSEVKTRTQDKVSEVRTRTQEKVGQVQDEHGTEVAIAAGTVLALVISYIVWRRRS